MASLQIVLNPRQDFANGCICWGSYLLSAAVSSGADIRTDAEVHPFVPRLQTKIRRCAVDLLDSSRTYHEESLDWCDIYFKRGYTKADVPARWQQKVLPFGLNYACRTRFSLANVLGLYLRRSIRPASLKKYLCFSQRRKHSNCLRKGHTSPKFYFRRVVWGANELGSADRPDTVNGYRIKLLRELKKTFGKRCRRRPDSDLGKLVYPDLDNKPALRAGTRRVCCVGASPRYRYLYPRTSWLECLPSWQNTWHPRSASWERVWFMSFRNLFWRMSLGLRNDRVYDR